jgi:hypothetical protein
MAEKDFQIVITEKSGIARKVACALCPIDNCTQMFCPHYFIDIFVHHFGRVDKKNHPIPLMRCRSKKLSKFQFPLSYWDQNENDFAVSFVYSSVTDGPKYANFIRSLKEIISIWDEPYLKKPVLEHVDWYLIRNGLDKKDWIVIYTDGNPQRLDFQKKSKKNKRKKKNRLTFNSCNLDLIKSSMRHLAKHSTGKSSRMRIMLIKHLLIESNYTKATIYVATDMDVAGSYIVATLPGFTTLSHEKKIFRIALHNMTEQGIREALHNSDFFDWHTVEAGRLRDTIDYVIGRGFSDIMRDISWHAKFRFPFTLGRTRLLALDCLYRRWVKARTWKEKGDLYLVFIGFGDRDSIIDQLSKQAFVGLCLKIIRGPFSPAGFLRELMYREIGTVSTRYKLVGELIKQGLALKEGDWLVPTQIGIMLQEQLLPHLANSNFSLWKWNHIINNYLLSVEEKAKKPLNELQDEIDNLIRHFLMQFLPTLVKSLPILSLLLKRIVLQGCNKTEKKADTKLDHNLDASAGYDICGLEGAVNLNDIKQFIDEKKNQLMTTKAATLTRGIPLPEQDWEGILRRTLNLEREVGYRVVGGHLLEHLPHLPEGMCTVFRGNCEPDSLNEKLTNITNSKKVVSNFERLNLEKLKEDPAVKGSHEPLGLFDVAPGDIPGPEGFLVAAEYMRPYRCTLDLHKTSLANVDLIGSFSCGGIHFQRIFPFKYGTVHTFDSLLASMYDRHKMPFDKTAEIAEALYLGSGLK